MIRSIGIDPGLTTGIAIVDFGDSGQEKLIFYKVLRTNKNDKLIDRIYKLSQAIDGILWGYSPLIIGYETHFHEGSHGIWTRDNKNTGNMFLNQQACGAILAVIAGYIQSREGITRKEYAYPICTSNPSMIRGKRARVVLKDRAQTAAKMRWSVDLPLDAADASQFALYAYQEYQLETRRIE